MQTNFTADQLVDPRTAEVERILRRCVHCGLCTAVCSTYVVLGDERDSPRGRIYLMKDMFEAGRAPSAEMREHIDRCLSCLSCTTTCPSGVDYMHLVDHARAYMAERETRPFKTRMIRTVLARILPYPRRMRWALRAVPLARPLIGLMQWLGFAELATMIAMAPTTLPRAGRFSGPGTATTNSERRGRVILMAGCAQQVLRPDINDATIRLLARRGVDVVVANGAGCCGALVHHLGREQEAQAQVKRNIDAWMKEISKEPIDAILINASGCGTMVKDYGHVLAHDTEYRDKAAQIAGLARDVSEFLIEVDIGAPVRWSSIKVAYHSACSLQHGQRITEEPKALLTKAGYSVADVPEGHICCGSAGTYNILQPDIARQLKERKIANIKTSRPDVVAAGNIGCITQLASGMTIPIVHTVELLDWAYGGPVPRGLEALEQYVSNVPHPKRTPEDFIAA
jgi:glycolate oxidase iron-sulfur subunit